MLKNISNLGISQEINKELVSKVRFANISSGYLAIACGLTSPVYYFSGLEELGLFLIPVTIGYSSVLMLNLGGFYTMARAVLLSVFILGAFYYASRLGSQFSIQYLMIPGFLGIQTLFQSSETTWRNLLSLGTFLLWMIYQSTTFNPIPRDYTMAQVDPFVPILSLISVGVIVFGSIALVFHFSRHEGDQLKEALYIAENDILTGLGTQFLLKNHNELRSPIEMYKLIVIEIHGLRRINEQHGWDFGNEVIKFFANALRTSFPDHCVTYRLSPTLFAAWAPIQVIDSRLEDSLQFFYYELDQSSFPHLRFSVGTADTSEDQDVSELAIIAQTRLVKYIPQST